MVRPAALLAAAAIAGLVLPVAASQDKAAPAKVPERGATVLAEGCLQGSTLRAAALSATDETGALATPLNYQLKGDKNLLKRMRTEHDGRLVRVTGVLKSKLPDRERHAGTIGKTRITVGVSSSSVAAGGAPSRADQPNPVLQVESYEGLGTHCG